MHKRERTKGPSLPSKILSIRGNSCISMNLCFNCVAIWQIISIGLMYILIENFSWHIFVFRSVCSVWKKNWETDLRIKEESNVVLQDAVFLSGPVLTSDEAVQVHVEAFDTPREIGVQVEIVYHTLGPSWRNFGRIVKLFQLSSVEKTVLSMKLKSRYEILTTHNNKNCWYRVHRQTNNLTWCCAMFSEAITALR